MTSPFDDLHARQVERLGRKLAHFEADCGRSFRSGSGRYYDCARAAGHDGVHSAFPDLTPEQLRDAAYTQVATSAVAYAEARLGFARMLATARRHGLTDADLVEASGRTEQLVAELLDEVDV